MGKKKKKSDKKEKNFLDRHKRSSLAIALIIFCFNFDRLFQFFKNIFLIGNESITISKIIFLIMNGVALLISAFVIYVLVNYLNLNHFLYNTFIIFGRKHKSSSISQKYNTMINLFCKNSVDRKRLTNLSKHQFTMISTSLLGEYHPTDYRGFEMFLHFDKIVESVYAKELFLQHFSTYKEYLRYIVIYNNKISYETKYLKKLQDKYTSNSIIKYLWNDYKYFIHKIYRNMRMVLPLKNFDLNSIDINESIFSIFYQIDEKLILEKSINKNTISLKDFKRILLLKLNMMKFLLQGMGINGKFQVPFNTISLFSNVLNNDKEFDSKIDYLYLLKKGRLDIPQEINRYELSEYNYLLINILKDLYLDFAFMMYFGMFNPKYYDFYDKLIFLSEFEYEDIHRNEISLVSNIFKGVSDILISCVLAAPYGKHFNKNKLHTIPSLFWDLEKTYERMQDFINDGKSKNIISLKALDFWNIKIQFKLCSPTKIFLTQDLCVFSELEKSFKQIAYIVNRNKSDHELNYVDFKDSCLKALLEEK